MRSRTSLNFRSIPLKMEEQLPDELLLIVFEDLPQQTSRGARLVNHQWNAVSTPLVFERIHTSLLSWSLAKLSALSQSPLAEHVKAIDFHTEQLCDLSRRTFKEYREDTRLPFLLGHNSVTHGELLAILSEDRLEDPEPKEESREKTVRYTPDQIKK